MTKELQLREWFAVYPDSIRMDLSDTNSATAFFKIQKDAHDFGKRKYGTMYIVKTVVIPFNETTTETE